MQNSELFTFAAYEARLRGLCDAKPEMACLQTYGVSLGGLPLYAVKITDPDVCDDEKFHVAVVCLHAGIEHSAFMAALETIEFMLSEAAAPYRRKYVITIAPCLNPDGMYVNNSPMNGSGIDPYTAKRGDFWNAADMSLKDPEKLPEVVAFMALMDETRPEILLDWHGLGRRDPGRIMLQYAGGAFSNQSMYPWAESLLQAIRNRINAEGVPPFAPLEEHLQRFHGMHAHRQQNPFLYRDSGDYVYTGLYPYIKYHTLPVIFEIAFEESALAGFRGILEYGLNPPAEYDGAFPVNTAFADWELTSVAAYGRTAGKRRESRCELWKQAAAIRTFTFTPEYVGSLAFAVTFGKSGYNRLLNALTHGERLRKGMPGFNNLNPTAELCPAEFIRKDCADTPDICWSAIGRFLNDERTPVRTFVQLQWQGAPQEDGCPLCHGLCLSRDIQLPPQAAFDVESAAVNGRAVPEDELAGWKLIRHANGIRFTVAIPPETAGKSDVFMVTLHYKTNVKAPE